MRAVAMLLVGALALVPLRAEEFASAGAFQTLDGKWRKAGITLEGGGVRIVPSGRVQKKFSLGPQEFVPAVVQYFVKSKRRALSGLIVGAGGVAGMYLALWSLRTRVDDALVGGNVGSSNGESVNSVFNALSGILYAVVAGIGAATAAGKSHHQHVRIETGENPPRSVAVRVMQSEFDEFRQGAGRGFGGGAGRWVLVNSARLGFGSVMAFASLCAPGLRAGDGRYQKVG